MIDGIPVIDAHQHVVRLSSLKMAWETWAPPRVTGVSPEALWPARDRVDPAAFVGHLDDEGVDVALLMAEYSPRVTGIQPAEDMVDVVAHAPDRLGFVAAVNPRIHFPAVEELERQLDLGAIACKLHPVHGDFALNDRQLYPLYARCQEHGIAVVIHCGTSNFAGASNRRADPAPLADVVRDFPDLTLSLAHGGRGWFYDAAAFLAQTYPNVWIEISGLPPKRLPQYYQRHDLSRLATRFVFGTDFPAIPGLAANVRQVIELGLPEEILTGVLWRNAVRAYRLDRHISRVRAWR